jgi:CubicO group peptidase (beta-lactamase class C family)
VGVRNIYDKNIIPLLEHFTEIGPVGCAISISLNGTTMFEHYQGFADAEKGLPITRDSIFRMYSNTKMLTITAALKLYEKGLFLMNDPIEEYLPEFARPMVCRYASNNMIKVEPSSRSITIRDLFTMCSGITYEGEHNMTQSGIAKIKDEFEKKGGYGTREFVKALARIPLAFEPGSHWNYGLGHDVVGALIEVVSGKSFGEFLKDEIFDPLEMNDTGFFLTDANRNCLTTLYHRQDGKLVPNYADDVNYEASHRYESGGAGLLSTLPDMTTFAMMLCAGGTLKGERILGRKTIDLMRRNHLSEQPLRDFEKTCADGKWEFLSGYGYGLGVRVMIDPTMGGCNGTVGEYGWAGAAGTWMLVDPEEKLAVVYLHQLKPDNREEYCHPRLRAAIYSEL